VPPGAGTPTGTVIFEINGAPFDTETLVNGSATSASLSDLTPGTYEATALYLGDTNFLASGGDIGQIVNPSSTQTVLSASPSAPVFGQPLSLSATVTPTGAGTGTPTGSVAFYDGQTLLGEVPLNASDVATLGGLAPSVGPHAYSAVYSGEYDYAGSTSSTLNLSVGVISTTTSVASSSNPSQYTGPVTFTATVAPSSSASPAPSGSVTFKDGSTTIGSAPLTATGSTYTASISVSSLAVGTHSIVASYTGAGDYGASSSSALTQTVTAAKTTLTASTLSGSTVSATLTTAYGPVAGQSVAFTAGSTSLCTATTSAQGVASCSLTGVQTLDVDLNGGYTATYAGSTDYTAATATGKS
jgi:Bacterial Ig-like domain (group 3)